MSGKTLLYCDNSADHLKCDAKRGKQKQKGEGKGFWPRYKIAD